MTDSFVTLHDLCASIGMIPREARIKLRALAKAKALPVAHAARGRWAWEPEQCAEVKKLLTAAATTDTHVATPAKPAAKAPAKPKPAKKAPARKKAAKK